MIGLGPILWLAKSAITPTNDTITHPMALFPHGTWRGGTSARRGTGVHVGRYFWNTVVLAAGSWFVQIVVATTGGYVLSVLQPRYGYVVTALLLATLFVPAVVLLVPLYIEIVHPPLIHHSFIESYWAIWLPAGASAFNVMIVKRFFDNLPREIFEAARIDGAGPFRLFFGIVLPLSKPILGVVSIFAVLASWKDFLWPLLVLTNPDKQPLSVRLPAIQAQTQARRLPGGHADRGPRPDRRVPRLPALLPARRRPRRRDQGLRCIAEDWGIGASAMNPTLRSREHARRSRLPHHRRQLGDRKRDGAAGWMGRLIVWCSSCGVFDKPEALVSELRGGRAALVVLIDVTRWGGQ